MSSLFTSTATLEQKARKRANRKKALRKVVTKMHEEKVHEAQGGRVPPPTRHWQTLWIPEDEPLKVGRTGGTNDCILPFENVSTNHCVFRYAYPKGTKQKKREEEAREEEERQREEERRRKRREEGKDSESESEKEEEERKPSWLNKKGKQGLRTGQRTVEEVRGFFIVKDLGSANGTFYGYVRKKVSSNPEFDVKPLTPGDPFPVSQGDKVYIHLSDVIGLLEFVIGAEYTGAIHLLEIHYRISRESWSTQFLRKLLHERAAEIKKRGITLPSDQRKNQSRSSKKTPQRDVTKKILEL